ncbi:ABC transporter permease [Peptococcus simiae]|uniref:ABC transporter permease n=1 Tax=Peptococcus simiae TaxID=1643805 RepID=UPI003980502F
MNITENIRLALESLRANKIRSLLTMLGIIIGIASVISILTIGDAMTSSISSSLSTFGSQNVYLYVNSRDDDYMYEPSEQDLISPEMLESMQARFGDRIVGVSLEKSAGSGEVRHGYRKANITLNGVSPGSAESNNIKILAGRFIREADVQSLRNTAVISDKMAKELYGDQLSKALNKEIEVRGASGMHTFTVVGIYEYNDDPMTAAMNGRNPNSKTTACYIPVSTAGRLTNDSSKGYRQVTVTAATSENTIKFTKELEDYMNQYYTNNSQFKILTQSVEEMTNQVNATLNSVKLAISVIAGISLLVGGIGVMNIMLVSVTERTREIGIRKALGATNFDIRLQFIVESIIVCVIGGLIGILTGGLFGFLGSLALKAATGPSLLAIFLATGFSMLIGVFFGYYPANKAAQLNPIDALRYE